MSADLRLGTSIVVFAKAPRPGRVKTRLASAVGDVLAAQLYSRLLVRTLQVAISAEVGRVRLYCYPDTEHLTFRQICFRFQVQCVPQSGENLGIRMYRAAQAELSQALNVLIIGTDCPVLCPEYLAAASKLLAQRCEAVIGPAEDGGYVLLGLNQLHPLLFNDVPWGSSQVANITRSRMRQLGWHWGELETLWDLDRPSDLDRLWKTDSSFAPAG